MNKIIKDQKFFCCLSTTTNKNVLEVLTFCGRNAGSIFFPGRHKNLWPRWLSLHSCPAAEPKLTNTSKYTSHIFRIFLRPAAAVEVRSLLRTLEEEWASTGPRSCSGDRENIQVIRWLLLTGEHNTNYCRLLLGLVQRMRRRLCRININMTAARHPATLTPIGMSTAASCNSGCKVQTVQCRGGHQHFISLQKQEKNSH